VGLAPPIGDPRALPPDSRVGRRLARLMNLMPDAYAREVDRINLLPRAEPDKFDERYADGLLPRLRGRRVVFLGRRVARAFHHDPAAGWYDWRLARGYVAAVFPHPSGRSRVWNDPEATAVAEDAFSRLRRPCIHVEGPDGAGKTVLAQTLWRTGGYFKIPTHGPPATEEESWALLDGRLEPGCIVDRSTGLVSELVYGPVVRGRTVVPEKELWSAVRAVRRVVTFVYCRPPFDVVRRHCGKARADEDLTHVTSVTAKIRAITDRYDEVMQHAIRLGCKVIEYDWTNDPVEQAAEAVCAA
jgi:hypothetical protein